MLTCPYSEMIPTANTDCAAWSEALVLENDSPVESSSDIVLVDPLTRLLKGRFLLHVLHREYRKAVKYRSPLACILIDLDHFGGINDTFGHYVGDEVLEQVAILTTLGLRSGDLLFRYGGDEFAALMPHRGCEEAKAACQRLLERLEEFPLITAAGPVFVTVSIGLAAYTNGNFLQADDLLEAANRALLSAKRRGGDRISVAMGTAHPPLAIAYAA